MNSNLGNTMSDKELNKVSGGIGDEIDTQNVSVVGSVAGVKHYPTEQSVCPECGSKKLQYVNFSKGTGTVIGQSCEKGHSWTFG
ncbi:MAG: bacteriocin [Firmicutes bacterium]|nr:bacteriocin [Bacillota bacterium]